MAALLLNFRNTIIASVILALIFIIGYGVHGPDQFGMIFWQAVFRWLHVVFGILWIGLLYYFNFVQIRVMPAIPAEQKPAVTKHIAPEYVAVLSQWRHRETRLDWSVHDFYFALARLGGHQNRKRDHYPGWLVLWRGWNALQLLVAGSQLADSRSAQVRLVKATLPPGSLAVV